MSQILNAHHFKGKSYPPNSVYVGRGKTSILGNPFSHLSSGTLAQHQVATREEAVSRYEEYARIIIAQEKELYEHYPHKQLFINAIKALKDKDLICWCAPRKCHAEVLIQLCKELTE